ncbi:sensor domain-containing diguanylate cyclase [Caldalkalibacillus mannanilyticus]|uniref:sensor domain-containing diguanylate cyclase n=1 Tax=Caldalkalibacillus mannanilyticus TaxID=1418 RepID=UPI000469C341|nr:diguanylate cyclase [Caldalkalibacillus mannanilyticus]
MNAQMEQFIQQFIDQEQLHTRTFTFSESLLFLIINEQVFTPSNSSSAHMGIHKSSLLELHQQISHMREDGFKIQFEMEMNEGSKEHVTIGVLCSPQEVSHREQQIIRAYLESIKRALLTILQCENKRIKHEILFDLSKKILSSIDVDQVLCVVDSSAKELFSDYDTFIWLSHDYNQHFPVKYLNFKQEARDYNTEAYIHGEILFYHLEGKRALSVPLRGKQGSYGVLQLLSLVEQATDPDKEVLSLIADTVGVALENAQLFQQSKQLINELRLITETSEQLSRSLNVDDNVDFVISKINEMLRPECIYFLSYQNNKNKYRVLASTNPQTKEEVLELKENTLIQEVHETEEPYIAFCPEQPEKKLFGEQEPLSYSSLVIVPMLNNNTVIGQIILTHSQANYFSYNEFRLLKTFVHHASFSFVNSFLHEDLNRFVITDTLTRLFTRHYLDQKIMLSQQKDLYGSFILIDIDNFKKVNDSFGHQVGDDILIQVANVMKSSIREVDIASRWGGEELAIYLPNIDIYHAFEIADRIRERVNLETSPGVTISCGLSQWKKQEAEKSTEILFQYADQSLYKAKREGKNKVIMVPE